MRATAGRPGDGKATGRSHVNVLHLLDLCIVSLIYMGNRKEKIKLVVEFMVQRGSVCRFRSQFSGAGVGLGL